MCYNRVEPCAWQLRTVPDDEHFLTLLTSLTS